MKSNFHEIYTPENILQALEQKFSDYIHNSVYEDIQAFTIDKGMGMFIRDNLVIGGESNMSIAVLCQWEVKKGKKERVPTFLKYHIYKGDVPDIVLDEINQVNEKVKNPTWTK